MSENPAASGPGDDPPGDEVRQHPQDPAEGPDEETQERGEVPRVHPEDPAEG
jgi:hypothetical protein